MVKNDNSLYTKGINKKTFDLLFDDLNNKVFDKAGSCESLEALCIISEFSKLEDQKRWFIVSGIYDAAVDDKFKTISWDGRLNSYIYQNGEFKIAFNLLSDFMLNEKAKSELLSNERIFKCQEESLALARSVPNSRVVTGYVYLESQRMLHSVVEYDNNGETIILDWTKNLFISKENYLKLTNFRVIETIELCDLAGDIYNPISKIDMDLKVYCAFRPEIVKELKKNNSIF